MTATPPASGSARSPVRRSASARDTNALAPGTRYSSKNGPRSPEAPAARAMCGRPIESARRPPRETASSRCRSTPSAPELLDDLAGAGRRARAGPARRRRRSGRGRSSNRICQVFGVLVDAGHLDRGNAARCPGAPAASAAAGDTGDRVMVRQGEARHARLGGALDDLGGCELAVGDGRMALKLDRHSPAD